MAMLPDVVQEFVGAVAHETQAPEGLVAMYALATLAACAQRSRCVEVRPGWTEMLALFVIVVARSGESKSPVVSRCYAPVRAWERDAREEYMTVAAEHAAKLEVLEVTAKDKSLTFDEKTDALVALSTHESAMPAPARVRVDDATPESLAMLAAKQSGSIAVISSEGSVLRTVLGMRYGKDRAANMEILLRGYSGEDHIVDRVGRELYIPSLSISVAVTVQPSVLHGLATIPGVREQGFLARCLFSFPGSLVGNRKWKASKPVPDALARGWAALVTGVLKLPAVQERPSLRLDTDAYDLIMDLRQRVEDLEGPGGELEVIEDWANKIAGQTARIAGLLALCDDPLCRAVSAGHVRRAALMYDYLVAHARRGLLISKPVDPVVEAGEHVLAWLHRNQVSDFSVRDAHRALQGRNWCTSASSLEAPLRLLVERGWLRAVPAAATSVGRPPSPRFQGHAAVVRDRGPVTKVTEPNDEDDVGSSVDSVTVSTTASAARDDAISSGSSAPVSEVELHPQPTASQFEASEDIHEADDDNDDDAVACGMTVDQERILATMMEDFA